jgi:hypothetical protein
VENCISTGNGSLVRKTRAKGKRRRVTVSPVAAAVGKAVDALLKTFPDADQVELLIWRAGGPDTAILANLTFKDAVKESREEAAGT